MIGRDVAVFKSTLTDPAWDYVALGHIHRHQNLTEGESGVPPVVYSGSLERIDFGEERETKGFCWIMLERGNTQWEFVPVAARPFVTIRVDVRGSQDPTATVLEAIERHKIGDAVVRVQIETTIEKEAELREREIDQALGKSYFVAAIQKEVDRPARSRLGTESPEALSPLELLERYLTAKETLVERRKTLLSRAKEIMQISE